jgi:hypothetical protein
MVIQLEDVVDCLQMVHPDFDYLVLFDHSSGHAKKRIGGLDAFERKKHTQYEEEDGTVDKTKQDLADELNQAELQSLAQARGIDWLKPKVKKIEGWRGALKGMLQVLRERGWIDERY